MDSKATQRLLMIAAMNPKGATLISDFVEKHKEFLPYVKIATMHISREEAHIFLAKIRFLESKIPPEMTPP
jgi:hypothetical protein